MEVIGCWGGYFKMRDIIDLLWDNKNDPRKGKLHFWGVWAWKVFSDEFMLA